MYSRSDAKLPNHPTCCLRRQTIAHSINAKGVLGPGIDNDVSHDSPPWFNLLDRFRKAAPEAHAFPLYPDCRLGLSSVVRQVPSIPLPPAVSADCESAIVCSIPAIAVPAPSGEALEAHSMTISISFSGTVSSSLRPTPRFWLVHSPQEVLERTTRYRKEGANR